MSDDFHKVEDLESMLNSRNSDKLLREFSKEETPQVSIAPIVFPENISSNPQVPQTPIAQFQQFPQTYKIPDELNLKELPAPTQSFEPKEPIVEKPKMTIAKKFFLGALAIFVFAGLFFAFTFLSNRNIASEDNIIVEITGQGQGNIGDDIPLSLKITNKNSVDLLSALIVIDYQIDPISGEKYRVDFDFGDINSGQSQTKDIPVKLLGEKGDTKNLNILLEYRLKGEGAIFTKSISHTVLIGDSPVALSFDSPVSLNSGEQLEFSVKIKSVSQEDLKDLVLIGTYPDGFTFKSSSPKADFENNVFDIGDLKQGDEKSIKIIGIPNGISGNVALFSFSLGTRNIADNKSVKILYNRDSFSVSFSQLFISTYFDFDGNQSDSFVANKGDRVSAGIHFQNNLDTRINNAEISVSISDGIIDASSIDSSSGGVYDAVNKKIVWTKATVPDLEILEPGQTGRLVFAFKIKNSTSSTRSASLTSFVKGVVPSYVPQLQSSPNNHKATVSLKGDIQFLAQLVRASGPFINTGNIPPSVGAETTYSVKWSIFQSGTDFSSAVLTTVLPSYVSWKNEASNTNIKFDPITRKVTWTIGSVKGNEAKEAYFKIGFIPLASQVGNQAVLINDSKIDAFDIANSSAVNGIKSSLRTSSVSDLNFPANGGIVVN